MGRGHMHLMRCQGECQGLLAIGAADKASLIVFDDVAQSMFEQEAIHAEMVSQRMTGLTPSGMTQFVQGLRVAYDMVCRHRLNVASECSICLHALQQPLRFRTCGHTFCTPWWVWQEGGSAACSTAGAIAQLGGVLPGALYLRGCEWTTFGWDQS